MVGIGDNCSPIEAETKDVVFVGRSWGEVVVALFCGWPASKLVLMDFIPPLVPIEVVMLGALMFLDMCVVSLLLEALLLEESGIFVSYSLLSCLSPSPIEMNILVMLVYLEAIWIWSLFQLKVLGSFSKPICPAKLCGFILWLLDSILWSEVVAGFFLVVMGATSKPI